MLNIINTYSDTSPKLVFILDEAARKHLSRYPINVEYSQNKLLFTDSRMTGSSKHKGEIANVTLARNDKDTEFFVIESHLLKNNQFNPGSHGYNSMRTSNPGKALKILQSVLVPLEPATIVHRLKDGMNEKYNAWVEDSQRMFTGASGLSSWSSLDKTLIMRDIVNYKQTGKPFTIGDLVKLSSDECIAAFVEMEGRKKTKKPRTFVFTNPDGIAYGAHVAADNSIPRGWAIEKFETYNNIGSLPKDVLEQQAMLKLLDLGTFVKDVGIRLEDNAFWVYAPLHSAEV